MHWQPTPVLLPGKSHGRRSLVGCSPWGHEESDATERLHFHFSLSCVGEGHGNPLQCSCLENPRDGGATRLPSLGLHRVGHDWSDLAAVAAAAYKPGYLVLVLHLLVISLLPSWASNLHRTRRPSQRPCKALVPAVMQAPKDYWHQHFSHATLAYLATLT